MKRWSLAVILALCAGLWAGWAMRPARAQAQVQAQPKMRPDGMPVNFPFREPDPRAFADHSGYAQIFNGKNLDGWDGDPSIWHVQGGDIVGVHKAGTNLNNTYLVYRGVKAKNFDLKLEIMDSGAGGSGVQYRSVTGKPWVRGMRPGAPKPNLNWMMTGPQADFWPGPGFSSNFSGQLYIENSPFGILAWRGQVVHVLPGRAPRLVGTIGDRTALGAHVNTNGWNQYLIMARGGTLIQVLNGQLTAVVVDDDASDVVNEPGYIGIEIESQPVTVSVRDVWLKKMP